MCQVETFKEGDKIIGEGEPGDKFYIIEASGGLHQKTAVCGLHEG